MYLTRDEVHRGGLDSWNIPETQKSRVMQLLRDYQGATSVHSGRPPVQETNQEPIQEVSDTSDIPDVPVLVPTDTVFTREDVKNNPEFLRLSEYQQRMIRRFLLDPTTDGVHGETFEQYVFEESPAEEVMHLPIVDDYETPEVSIEEQSPISTVHAEPVTSVISEISQEPLVPEIVEQP